MEACRGSTSKCSSNLGLGVKSPSSLVIAGSYRSWPQSSLGRDNWNGRATDQGLRSRKGSALRPTPNNPISKKPRDGECWGKLHFREGNNPDYS